jgi:predicted patatin/cPLA2 family phospholipase
MKNTGLVLEGGGMRGTYTCGVLEYFMDKELYFNYIVGVSAGACNAVSYISKQKGRNEKISIGYVNDWRYMSFRNLIKNKSYFGMDFIFEEIPNKYVAFDYETFEKSQSKFVVGVTDCVTGKPMYLNKEDINNGFHGLRATASLPLISPIVRFKGKELLDGGIAAPIPIYKSIEDGNKKHIVVLTRNKEYRKTPMSYPGLMKIKYKKYPNLVNAMIDRHNVYNKTLEFLEEQEKAGKVLIIRPTKEVNVSRTEKDPEKLRELFKDGYEDAKRMHDKIVKFLNLETAK